MLNLTSAALKVFLALDPCDMRKSINGLHTLASDQLQSAPARDALFVFTNKRRNRINLLYFDGTGLWVAAKRLEEGRFSWPSPSEPGQRRIKLHAEALQLLIDGVDLRGAAFKPWYERAELDPLLPKYRSTGCSPTLPSGWFYSISALRIFPEWLGGR